MRILRLHIENFGKLRDFDLELEDGLTVISAKNGWGKSTLAAFIKAMFYGLTYTTKRALKENERKRYLPWQGGAYGGNMEFLVGSKKYRVERFFGVRDKEDTFALYDLNTGLLSEDYSKRLGEELFLVDCAAYERSSFFIQQDLGTSINDSLSAGLSHMEKEVGDLHNYEQAIASLETQMKYFQKTGNRGLIGKLREEKGDVLTELSECRRQEEAVLKWNVQLSEKEQELQGITKEIEALKKVLYKAQDYGQMEAKRVQYDHLRSEAEARKEELQKTAVLLAEFTSKPPKEEELDRCREKLYQLDGLRQQEEYTRAKIGEASRRLSVLEEAMDESGPGMILGVMAALLPITGGILCAQGKGTLGTILILAGVMLLLVGILQSRRHYIQVEQQKKQMSVEEENLKNCEHEARTARKNQEALKKKICRFLQVAEHTGVKELEDRWRCLREESRQYTELKQIYEMQRKEASKSRELWFQYGESLTEEERGITIGAVDRDQNIQRIKIRLRELEEQRETFLKELQGIRHQVAKLLERAEQIPVLEEEEERLTKRLEEAVKEHGVLKKTMDYLKMAREQFSVRYVKELQERIEEYLKSLGIEETREVLVDAGLEIKVQEAGAYREIGYFSAGLRDLYAFVERLAIVDVLYKKEKPTLVVDDPFVNLDKEKREQAEKMLEERAKKGQVVYFMLG